MKEAMASDVNKDCSRPRPGRRTGILSLKQPRTKAKDIIAENLPTHKPNK